MAEEITRREQFYAAILGEGQIPEPKTREEQYLQRIAQNGGGGGGTTNYNSLNNKPQVNGVTLSGDKSTEDLIPIGDGLQFNENGELEATGGGTTNYNDLSNKPQINGVALQGDKSISDLFDGKVDIGIGTVEESGYAELKDENGDRIFRASSANGEASVESGGLIGQPGALVLYNGEGGLSSVRPKSGVIPVEVDLPAENGTLALDSQIASSQTPAKAAVVTVNDAAPINAEDITVDITPVQDLHGYDRPWAGGAGKNKFSFVASDFSTAIVVGLAKYIAVNFPPGTYTASSNCPTGYLWVGDEATWGSNRVFSGNPITFTLTEGQQLYIGVNKDDVEGSLSYQNQIEEGSTVTSFAPYSNICPIEGRTGAGLTQKDAATNPTVTRTYSTDFGETVHGGKWHVTAGGTDKTLKNVEYSDNTGIERNNGTQYFCDVSALGVPMGYLLSNKFKPITNASEQSSPGVCYINANGKIRFNTAKSYDSVTEMIADIGTIQFSYELATPTTISTPKQNVPMLKGINTVYADCGDTQLKYQPDNVIGELKGMIQALDARVTALEEAE